VFRCDTGGSLQSQDRSPQSRPVASECVCDWLRDATGLDCGDGSWLCIGPHNDMYIRRMPSAFQLQWEAAKDSTVRYHTDESGASGSYYIFCWSCVYNCIRFISAFCNLVTSSPRSLMGNLLAAGLWGAGFASGCNFVFHLILILGSVGLGFRIRDKVRISRVRVIVVV